MASSASDAGHSEKLIREQLVKTGAVDIMVSIGNNFFYTRSLPCTLWFYDRNKENKKDRRDKILMLDARKVYRKVTSTINDFSPEQLASLTAIVKAYRGDNSYLLQIIRGFIRSCLDVIPKLINAHNDYGSNYHLVDEEIDDYGNEDLEKTFRDMKQYDPLWTMAIQDFEEQYHDDFETVNDNYSFQQLKELHDKFGNTKLMRKEIIIQLGSNHKHFTNSFNQITKTFELRKEKKWKDLGVMKMVDEMEISKNTVHELMRQIEYYHHAAEWLLKRFPDGSYRNVDGLCRVVSQQEVADKDYSLSPGRYVGVDTSETDNSDYAERLQQIHMELEELNSDAVELAKNISNNYNKILA